MPFGANLGGPLGAHHLGGVSGGATTTGNSTSRTTGRANGVQMVAAFSCCSDDPKNNDGGHITGLALDHSQHIVAVDNDAGVVKVFDQLGVFQYSFGKGLLVEPFDVFITSSGWYNCICKFRRDSYI